MSFRDSENHPWPRQTAAPSSSSHKRSSKRRRIDSSADSLARAGSRSYYSRQALEDQVQAAEEQCNNFSGNDVESCFPTSSSVFAQSQFVTFVWNSRLPTYAQTNKVNIYLFHGDSNEQILQILNVDNSNQHAGFITRQVNDSWWGSNGPDWSGTNTSYPFYWAITPNTTTFNAAAATQTHFTAVQTTFPDSIISSMSASSVAASSSSASASRASASSASAASAASASGSGSASSAAGASSSSNPNSPGNLQSGSGSSGFPHWAIAVIVVLGFLAIATSCILAFFIMRRLRRRRQLAENRNSMGSASPMMAHVQSPGSPLLPPGGQSSVGHGGGAGVQRAPSLVSPDGASSISHGGSAGEGGPFSGADAAIIANAFRTMLRKPDFADATVEEGDSPGSQDPGRVELNRELAEEGRDIRSVSSSRGVRVDTLSDDGDTVQDHGH